MPKCKCFALHPSSVSLQPGCASNWNDVQRQHRVCSSSCTRILVPRLQHQAAHGHNDMTRNRRNSFASTQSHPLAKIDLLLQLLVDMFQADIVPGNTKSGQKQGLVSRAVSNSADLNVRPCLQIVPGPSQGNSPCRLQNGPGLVEDILDCGACGCIVDQQDSITQLSTQVEAFCTWLLDGNTVSKDINMLKLHSVTFLEGDSHAVCSCTGQTYYVHLAYVIYCV